MTRILTDEIVDKIVAISEQGVEGRFIAERFGVSPATISNALKRRRERMENGTKRHTTNG